MDFLITLLSTANLPIFIGCIVVLVVFAYFFPVIVFKLYNNASSELTIAALKEIIYQLDKLGDELENAEKREAAIDKLGTILSIKGISIPRFMRGWIVDAEVKHIRNLQKQSVKDTDLHKNED